MDEVGRNARHVSKLIDALRQKGRLHEHVPLDTGGTLRIELNHRSFHQLQEIFIEKTNDNRILAVAKNLSLEEETKENGRPVILVSKDVLVRVKADAIGLLAEDFLNDRVVDNDEMYSGYKDLYISQQLFSSFYGKNQISVNDVKQHAFYPNQFALMKDELGGSSSAVGIADKTGTVLKDSYLMMNIYGESGRKCTADNGIRAFAAGRYSACHPDRQSGNRQNALSFGGRAITDRRLGNI